MRFFLATLALFLLTAAPAYARIAKIRWENVPNAVRYEIRILQGGEEIVKSVSEGSNPSWRGALSPGYFVYQIRGVDRLGVAGEWTPSQLILVKPREAQPLSPGNRAQLTLTEKEGRLFLRWRAMGRRVKYLVEIRHEKQRLDRTVLEKSDLELENPSSGNYRWRVTPLIQAEGSVEPRFLEEFDAITKGETSKWQEFDLELDAGYLKAKERFMAPRVATLPDRMPVPYGKTVEVAWDDVEAAEAYEIRYVAVPRAPYRDLSSLERRSNTITVREPRVNLPVENGKRYEVHVRALSRFDARGVASIVSPESRASFEIDDTAVPQRPLHFLSLVSSLAPYRDARVSPSQGYQGDIEGAGVGIELGLRYYLTPQLQGDFNAFFEQQDVEGARDTRTEQRLYLHYVWNPGGVQSGWALKAGAGLARLNYSILSPVTLGANTTTETSQVSMLALIPSFELEKRLFENLTAWADVKLPYLVSSSGSGSRTNLRADFLSNLRATLGVRWHLGDGFHVLMVLSREQRTIQFTENGIDGEISRPTATRAGLGVTYAW